MKKYILLLIPFILYAKFASNKSCAKCHPKIYAEYQTAMHSKATIFKDPIHNAMWKISPDYKKKKYSCGVCHTPSDTTMMGAIEHNLTMIPDANSSSENDAVSCAYCHRIKKIKIGEIQNKNITNVHEKVYFGNIKNPIKNDFHQSKSNKNFKNGNVCIGCHSHYKNKYGVNICSTNDHNELESSNCVSCHMPKVDGKPSKDSNTTKHTFHGFAGIHSGVEMLSKYVSLEILRGIDRFFIAINNKSPHALTLHPMRVMQLKVFVVRDKNITNFPTKSFVRELGDDNNITTPWKAKELIKNTSIKGNEKRVSTYMFALKKGDIVDVTVGYYLLNKDMIKKLGLEKKGYEDFITLKRKVFIIKQ